MKQTGFVNRKRTIRRRDFYTPESNMFGNKNLRPAIVKLPNNAFRKGNDFNCTFFKEKVLPHIDLI